MQAPVPDPVRSGRFLSITDGWLDAACRVPSPNCDERPAGVAVDLLVVHNISLPPGEFGGDAIDQLFRNCLDPTAHPAFADIATLRVSAHVLIRRDGSLVQYVPFHRRAWHAGESVWQGRRRCNDFSVGIELEGTDDSGYTGQQYQQLAAVAAMLQQQFPGITPARLVGHCDIAPGRKTDPGDSFSWQRLRRALAQQPRERSA